LTLIDKLIRKYERTVRDMIETTEIIDILKQLKEECDDTTKRT
jgi:vacuolar-type H+-ATPase subunit D/Vma8